MLDELPEYPPERLLDDELRSTEEEPVLRRTTSSLTPARLLPDERTAPTPTVAPARSVITRTAELRSAPPVTRLDDADAATREPLVAPTAPRLGVMLGCTSRRVEAPAEVR